MTVAITETDDAGRRKIFDIESDADADDTVTIPHGLAGTPTRVWLVPMAAEFYLSAPFISDLDGTNIVLTLATTTNSGVAGTQIRVLVEYGEVS